MHKEPIFKSALIVMFFWALAWYAWHPAAMATTWHRGMGSVVIALAALLGMAILGVLLAFWLSCEFLDDRIKRLEPTETSGVMPTIGSVPLHKLVLAFHRHEHDTKGPRASLAAAFKVLRESDALIAPDMRRLAPSGDQPGRYDAIDLDEIERTVLQSSEAHVAAFDKLLRILMHTPDLLTTYEKQGHGRHNGVGGRTLLQHSLLVCQKCIDIAPKTRFDGIHGRERIEKKLKDDVTAVYYRQTAEIMYGVRQRVIESFEGDPLVPLIGLAHDIGKIECYEWRPGESEPYGLRPNHDLVGAHILARMPELWALPSNRIGNTLIEDDRDILIGAIAFYHHPSEQPMDWIAGSKPGQMVPQIRSDRMIGLMELLIRADRMTGAIENNADAEAVQEAALLESADARETFIILKEDESSLLWEAVEAVLIEPDRINAALEKGQPSGRSVGFVVEAPDWSPNPILALIETAFTSAVVNRADIPQERKEALLKKNSDNKNAAMVGTRAILSLLAKRGALIHPPGQPDYAPESSVWQVQFFSPENIYERGDFNGARFQQPSGSPQFQPPDMMLCDPTNLFPSVAGREPYGYAIHCVGNRMGGAGQTHGKGKGKAPPKDRLSGLDQAAQAMDATTAATPGDPEDRHHKRRPPAAAKVRRPEPGSEADIFISQLKLMINNHAVHLEAEPQDGWYRVAEQYERIIEMLGMRQHMDAIARSVERMDSAGIALRECEDGQGNPCRIVLADSRWATDGPQEPAAQNPTPCPLQDVPLAAQTHVPDENANEEGDEDTPGEEEMEEEAPPPISAPKATPTPDPVIETLEDPYTRFQRTLAEWLRGNPSVLKGPQKRGNRDEYGVLMPVAEIFEALKIDHSEVALAQAPVSEDFLEDFYVTQTANGQLRILIVSADWLECRDIAIPKP